VTAADSKIALDHQRMGALVRTVLAEGARLESLLSKGRMDHQLDGALGVGERPASVARGGAPNLPDELVLPLSSR
jgi:hypothetical protein